MLDIVLYLQFTYLSFCLIMASVQICLIIRHKTSKPTVMVTLSDMIVCDLSAVFLLAIYLAAMPFVAPSVKLDLRPVLASFTSVSITCVILTLIFFLLSKILVQYFQVRLRVVDLTDRYKQDDVLRFIRLAITFMVASLSIWIHAMSGKSPVYYYMMEEHFPPKSFCHAAILVMIICSLSLACLLLKCVTYKEKKTLLTNTREDQATKTSICTYFVGVLTIVLIWASLVVTLLLGYRTVHLFLRHIYFGFFSIVLPGIMINKDKSLRKFCNQKFSKIMSINLH